MNMEKIVLENVEKNARTNEQFEIGMSNGKERGREAFKK